jgi:hypothetical protein
MPGLETLILEPDISDDLLPLTERLFTDMQVGAVALRNIVDPKTVAILIEEDGRGFSKLGEFQNIYSSLSRQINHGRGFTVDEIGSFTWGHPWHLSEINRTPMVRTWLHLRGEAHFWLSRDSDPSNGSGFWNEDTEVDKNGFAKPAVFIPNPGDALLFVDRGHPEITGTSTFHKVETPRSPKGERFSVACDTIFEL